MTRSLLQGWIALAVVLAAWTARAQEGPCPGAPGPLPPGAGEVVGRAVSAPGFPMPAGWALEAGRIEACAIVLALKGPGGVPATVRLVAPGSAAAAGSAGQGRHFGVVLDGPAERAPDLLRVGLAVDAAFPAAPWVQVEPPEPAPPPPEQPALPGWAAVLLGILELGLLGAAAAWGMQGGNGPGVGSTPPTPRG